MNTKEFDKIESYYKLVETISASEDPAAHGYLFERAMKNEGVRFGLNITQPNMAMFKKACEAFGLTVAEGKVILEDVKEHNAIMLGGGNE